MDRNRLEVEELVQSFCAWSGAVNGCDVRVDEGAVIVCTYRYLGFRGCCMTVRDPDMGKLCRADALLKVLYWLVFDPDTRRMRG